MRPKPMVEVGGRPILWHIMKHYAALRLRRVRRRARLQGRGRSSATSSTYTRSHGGPHGRPRAAARSTHHAHDRSSDWIVHLVDTGAATNTGGRVKRLRVAARRRDVHAHVRRRRLRRRPPRAARVPPGARQDRDGDRGAAAGAVRRARTSRATLVARVHARSRRSAEGWINGGFFVFEPAHLRLPRAATTRSLEARRARAPRGGAGSSAAFRHDGFWQCMDTLRDKRVLEALWDDGRRPVEGLVMSDAFLARSPDARDGRAPAWSGALARAAPGRAGRRRRLPGARLGAADRELVRYGLIERRQGRARRRPRPGAARARPRRVRDRHRHPPGRADDRHDRQPQPGLDASRPTSPAPGRCSRPAGAAPR